MHFSCYVLLTKHLPLYSSDNFSGTSTFNMLVFLYSESPEAQNRGLFKPENTIVILFELKTPRHGVYRCILEHYCLSDSFLSLLHSNGSCSFTQSSLQTSFTFIFHGWYTFTIYQKHWGEIWWCFNFVWTTHYFQSADWVTKQM